MSGGHFAYYQDRISDLADDIERVIEKNDSTETDQYGYSVGYGFTPETVEQFRSAVKALRIAYVYAQRVDWLVSADDGEDSFHRRLAEDLAKVGVGG